MKSCSCLEKSQQACRNAHHAVVGAFPLHNVAGQLSQVGSLGSLVQAHPFALVVPMEPTQVHRTTIHCVRQYHTILLGTLMGCLGEEEDMAVMTDMVVKGQGGQGGQAGIRAVTELLEPGIGR